MTLNMFLRHVHPLYQAPDAPTDPEPIDPAIVADPVADVGDVDPPEPEPIDPEPQPDPQHGNKGKSPWFMDRISDLSHRARQAEEKAASAERKAREAEELLARLQRNDKADPAPITRQPQPTGDADIDARVAERIYQQNVNQIIQRGRTAVGREQFDKSAGVLVAVAGDQVAHEIVNAVYNVDPDHAHLIVHQLGNDPDRVADLIAMNPVQKVAEITRIAMTAAAPKTEPKAEPKAPAKVVSRAPPPPPPVDPGAARTVNFKSSDSDKMSDEEWSKQWDSEYTTPRASRRR